MQSTQSFQFQTQHKISWPRKILATVVALAIAVLVCYLCFSFISPSGWWLILIILLATLVGIAILLSFILADRHPLEESVQLESDKIQSQLYGTIPLSELLFCYDKTYGPFTNVVELKLRDGKSIKWKTGGIAKSKVEDSKKVLNRFLNALTKVRKTYDEEHREALYPKQYQFNFVRPSGFWYGLICFAFFPFLFLIDDLDNWGLWLFPLLVIPIAVGIVLMIKKTMRREKVGLFNDHLESKLYGKIDFFKVETLVTADSKLSPGATLILANQSKIKWSNPNFGSSNREAVERQSRELWQFTQDLAELLEMESVAHKAISSKPSSPKPISTKPVTSSANAPSSKPVSAASTSNSSTQRPKKRVKHIRKRRAGYIGIPVGLAVGIFIFARQCSNDVFQDHPLQDATKSSMQAKQEALGMLDRFTQNNAPYFLAANDTVVKLVYMPSRPDTLSRLDKQIKAMQQSAVPGALKRINAGFDLKKMMRYAQLHPDSVQWHMTLIYRDTTVMPLVNNSLFQADTAETHLYVAVYNPKMKLQLTPSMAAYRKRKGLPDSVEVKKVCAIPVYTDKSLNKGMTNHKKLQLNSLLAVYHQAPQNTTVFIAAKANDSLLTQQKFTALLKEFKTYWTKHELAWPKMKPKTID